MTQIYDPIISAFTSNFSLLSSCNQTCQLIIINGGGGEGVLGALGKVVFANPEASGMSDLVAALSGISATLYSGTHGYVLGLSEPSVSGELDDQEKAIAWVAGIQGLINSICDGSDGVSGENAETVCGCLSDCTNALTEAATDFVGYP